MADGDEDCVFFGTPLEREEELSLRQRGKAVQEGRASTLPAWKQTVTDENGKRRFHGAFTGGFSAGYFNSVGSKQGWAPAAFVSSRSSRAEKKAQSAYDFMDEDEKQTVDSEALAASEDFDTFGLTAAALARKQAQQEAQSRPGAIPGLLPDEVILPAVDAVGEGAVSLIHLSSLSLSLFPSPSLSLSLSLSRSFSLPLSAFGNPVTTRNKGCVFPGRAGVSLLRKMGWRPGRSVGPSHEVASKSVRRKARRAMLALAAPQSTVPEAVQKFPGAEKAPQKKMYGAELPPEFMQSRKDMAEEESGRERQRDEEDEEEGEEAKVPSTTPVYVVKPKTDFYGFGFDPYKQAPEFRAAKQNAIQSTSGGSSRIIGLSTAGKGGLFRPRAGTMAGGFGIGALEEVGEEDEDVYAQDFATEVVSSDEDETEKEPTGRGEPTTYFPSSIPKAEIERVKVNSLTGFKPGSVGGGEIKWYSPPAIPPDFVPFHRFSSTRSEYASSLTAVIPDAVPPPTDPNIRTAIEGLAVFVARGGQQFEDIVREKQMGNSTFSFLFGGPGMEYYTRRLWEVRQKRREEEGECVRGGGEKTGEGKCGKEERLDAEQRGRLLGERALPRTEEPITSLIAPEDRQRLMSALAGQFERGVQQDMDAHADMQPFKGDLAKQKRFEEYVREKVSGGLRMPSLGSADTLSPSERASEIAEFERAASMAVRAQPTKAEGGVGGSQGRSELAAMMECRFTSGGAEATKLPAGLASVEDLQVQSLFSVPLSAKKFPYREIEPWRPVPLLCKRYNVPDPFAGKAPSPPKPRSRVDSLTLTLTMPLSEVSPTRRGSESVPTLMAPPFVPAEVQKSSPGSEKEERKRAGEGELGEAKVELIQDKPIDLFKAIFSDEESGEEEDEGMEGTGSLKEVEKEKSKAAEAAKAALNRLEASDFLESLGSELGLELPPAPAVDVQTQVDTAMRKEREREKRERWESRPPSGSFKGTEGVNSGSVVRAEDTGEGRRAESEREREKHVGDNGAGPEGAPSGHRRDDGGREDALVKAPSRERLHSVGEGDVKVTERNTDLREERESDKGELSSTDESSDERRRRKKMRKEEKRARKEERRERKRQKEKDSDSRRGKRRKEEERQKHKRKWS